MGKEKVRINIVVIGHASSGKSTTTAHLLYNLGGIENNVIESLEKEPPSVKYAWVLDKLKDDHAKGATIDMSKFETDKYSCTVIDAPGQSIKNITTGASLANCAVLVIDSNTTTIGQTLEHALLAFNLDVDQIICCCNKMDATTPKYSMVRYSEISDQVLSYLVKVGYNSREISFIPISSLDGDNLIKRSTNFDWYSGPTLLEAIDNMKEPERPSDLALRLSIQDFYNIGGIRDFLVGRVETGCLHPRMSVTFAPTGLEAEVESVELYPGTRLQADVNSSEMHREPLNVAYPGDIVRFNVNVSATDLKQGYVASNLKDDPAMEAEYFTSHVIITNHPNQIEKGYTPILHCHTSHIHVKFAELICKVDNRSRKLIEKGPPFLKNGDACIIKMIPTKPLVVEPFSLYPPLSRFVIEDLDQIVAVGVVINVTSKITKN